MSEQEKKAYRKAIWLEWRKIVARKKLSSYEYKLVDEWFARGVEIAAIIRAIHRAIDRAQKRSLTVYSLGFISNDIPVVQRELARMRIGEARRTPGGDRDWRAGWAGEYFEEMIAETMDPERRAMLGELKEAIPTLTEDQAKARLKEIFE